MNKLLLIPFLAAAMIPAGAALAETHTVEMLNRSDDGQYMVFEPAYLEVAPGDTVTFVPTDPSHNAETIPGLLPEGGETFKGKFNQEVSITPTKEGVYGVKCLPHYGMGMVALIKVGQGEPGNLADAATVTHPGKAQDNMTALLDQAE